MRPIALIFSFVALLVATSAIAQDLKLIEAAKKEGKLIVYGTMQSDIFELLQKSFQKKTGIVVDYWRTSATKVVERARRSARRQGALRLGDVHRRHAPNHAQGRHPGEVRIADGQRFS